MVISTNDWDICFIEEIQNSINLFLIFGTLSLEKSLCTILCRALENTEVFHQIGRKVLISDHSKYTFIYCHTL